MKVVVRHSGCADIESLDQSVLNLKNMTDSFVRQHLPIEIAHDLMDLDELPPLSLPRS